VEGTRVGRRERLRIIREGPQRGQVLLLKPGGRQASGDVLKHEPRLEHFVKPGFCPVQVQDHGVDHSVHRGLGHH
jgi:hypothetical protein